MNSPKVEHGVVVGNTYDKYGTRNPLARFLVDRFLASFDRLVDATNAKTVLEVGCGEGHLAKRLAERGKKVVASDLSATMIELARRRARSDGLAIQFEVGDLFSLTTDRRFDLVVCCEVLEHVAAPDEALERLSRIADSYLLLSVPREPLWRMLNLARLSYVRDLGNTPGHVQHWSRREFLALVSCHADVIKEDSPLPWTMVLARPRLLSDPS